MRWQRGLHRFAVGLAAATLFLIVAGAMVTSTGSGLAVPDWPTTYGQNMFTFPYSKWVGGIFYEHGHRLIASTVGFLTIILAVWLQAREPRLWVRVLGWVALGAVIAQGILGGLTVRYLLPTPVSVAHACLAQAFFCIVVAIAVFTSRGWMMRTERPLEARAAGLFRPCLMLTIVVFVQLILGAVMRHTQSGLAVPDFPLAYGRVLPPLTAEAVEGYNHERRWEHNFLPEVSASQIGYHLAHRYWAAVVTAGMAWTCIVVLRRAERPSALTTPAAVGLTLVALQIVLGAWTVLSVRNPFVASAHVAAGAATLACAWIMALQAAVHRTVAIESRAADALPAGAAA